MTEATQTTRTTATTSTTGTTGTTGGRVRSAATARGTTDGLRRSGADGAAGPARRVAVALPLRVELARQLGRRRTRWVAALVVVLPVLLVGAFALGSDDGGGATTFVDLATSSAGNFATFTLFAATGFLLVVLVTLLAGDSVASEASWSSLRYLLAAPVPRSRLLRAKLLVAAGCSAAGVVGLVVVALAVGALAYGWGPVTSPTGVVLGPWEAVGRLGLVIVYILVQLSWAASLAFWLGTRTDAPLGAVGGAVMAQILSAILDTITALGGVRPWLPSHDQYAWTSFLGATTDWEPVLRGASVSVALSVVLLTAAWAGFGRRDVTS